MLYRTKGRPGARGPRIREVTGQYPCTYLT
jgi:hypothetical protein